jgi:HAD superfamily hydrolase (TIGR01450 family)
MPDARLADADLTRLLATPTRDYRGYIFDLDGTVHLGKELLPGALRLIDGLRQRGARIIFLTNNPTRDPQQYLDKLTGLGIDTGPDEILNTVMTMTSWLLENAADKNIFVIGEQPLQSALTAAGLRLTDRPQDIDIVVASYDRTFEYRKLQIAFDALARRARRGRHRRGHRGLHRGHLPGERR